MKSLLFLLISAGITLGGPISGPETFQRDTIAEFSVKAKGMLNVPIPKGLSVKQTPTVWYISGCPGTYTLSGSDYWVDFEAKKFGFDPVNLTFSIFDPAPPVPPAPPLPPVPPGPDPSVRTNPFTDDVPRILIVYDPLGPAMTATQSSIVYGADARKAMETFAPNDGLRIWPKGQVSTTKVWSDALARPAKSYPWILVGKGKTGYEGPLNDSTVPLFIDWLNKFSTLGEAKSVPDVLFGPAPSCRTMYLNGRLVQVCQ